MTLQHHGPPQWPSERQILETALRHRVDRRERRSASILQYYDQYESFSQTLLYKRFFLESNSAFMSFNRWHIRSGVFFSSLTFNTSRSSSSHSRWCEAVDEDVLTVSVSVPSPSCLSGFVCLACSHSAPVTASPTAQITTSTKHPEENTLSLIPDCSILSIQRHRLPFRDSRLPK